MKQEYSLKDASVYIVIPVMRDFPASTTMSLIETAVLLTARGIPFDIKIVQGNSIVQEARNMGLAEYNRVIEGYTHLFLIDSDATWRPTDFFGLLCMATQMPVVCAAQPYKKEPLQWPLTFSGEPMNEHGCLSVQRIGLPFVCLQREVVQTMITRAPMVREHGRPQQTYAEVFKAETRRGTFQGEDTNFCEDLIAAGYKVWLCPFVDIGHVGAKEYKGSLAEALKQQAEKAEETPLAVGLTP